MYRWIRSEWWRLHMIVHSNGLSRVNFTSLIEKKLSIPVRDRSPLER